MSRKTLISSNIVLDVVNNKAEDDPIGWKQLYWGTRKRRLRTIALILGFLATIITIATIPYDLPYAADG